MNIELLNLSNLDNMKANVSEVTGEIIPYVAVRLSLPSGSIRIHIPPKNYTHIRWTLPDGDSTTTYYAEITQLVSLGGDLVELYYDASLPSAAIKTFFDSRNASKRTDLKYFCERSTDQSLWNKFVNDSAFPRTGNLIGNSSYVDFDSSSSIVVVMSYSNPLIDKTFVSGVNVAVYVMTYTNFCDLLVGIANDQYGAKVLGKIMDVYVLPWSLESIDGITSQDTQFIFDEDQSRYNFGCKLIKKDSSNRVRKSVGTLPLNIYDYTDIYDKSIGIQLPYAGYIPVDSELITSVDDIGFDNNIAISYILDVIEGTVKVSIESKAMMEYGPFKLPRLSVSQSSVGTALEDAEAAAQTKTLLGIVNGIGQMASSIADASLTSSSLAQIGIGGVTNAIKSNIEYNATASMLRRHGTSYSPATSGDGLCTNRMIIETTKYEGACGLHEWSLQHGYVVNQPIETFTEGVHYWLDNSTHLKGVKWLVDGVFSAFKLGFEY